MPQSRQRTSLYIEATELTAPPNKISKRFTFPLDAIGFVGAKIILEIEPGEGNNSLARLHAGVPTRILIQFKGQTHVLQEIPFRERRELVNPLLSVTQDAGDRSSVEMSISGGDGSEPWSRTVPRRELCERLQELEHH
jgi:hypothetical protein